MFSNVWSENTALFERLMEIHSNSPKLYYGFNVFHQGLGNIQMIKDILICSLLCPWNTAQASVDPHLECSQPFNIIQVQCPCFTAV